MKTAATGSVSSSSRPSSQPGAGHTDFRVTTECAGSAVMLRVGGDIDASNERTWRRALSRSAAVAAAPGPLVIDALDLDFMGSCAFAALAQEAVRCQRRGLNLRLVSRQPVVARIVAACGLRQVVSLYPTVDAALSPPSCDPSGE